MLLHTETLLLNRYFIIRHIGYSGTTIFYDAKDQVSNQTVILKQNLIPDTLLQKPLAHQIGKVIYFMRRSAQDCFTNEQGEFTVIRDRLSDDLETLLQRQKRPFAKNQVVEWANQLLYTLEYLHSRSMPIIHGHITPSRLKLSPQNEIILLHHPTTYSSNEVKRELQGKLSPYASPELLNGFNIDYSSDLYSLGATLSYLLTGKEPPTALVRMYALTHQHPDPLDSFNQFDLYIRFELAKILITSLHLSPIERPSSARAMRKALNWVTSEIKYALPRQARQPLMQKPRLDRPPLLLYEQSAHHTKRFRLNPVNLFLITCLFLIMLTLININSPFTVYGDTRSPTTIRLTIPTPIIESTPLVPREVVPKQ